MGADNWPPLQDAEGIQWGTLCKPLAWFIVNREVTGVEKDERLSSAIPRSHLLGWGEWGRASQKAMPVQGQGLAFGESESDLLGRPAALSLLGALG